MKRSLLAVAACCLVVAGCGATHSSTPVHHDSVTTTSPVVAVTPPAPAPVASSCNPDDLVMQCELGPPPETFEQVAPSVHGLDFGWSAIDASEAKRLGAHFGASYLSVDASKDWTRSLVDAYHRAGLATVAVWETSANRAQDGRAAGAADARQARSEAAAIGDTTEGIDFAIDCPCAPSSVLAYFQGAHSVLGSRTGAYGDGAVIAYLHAHGVVGDHNWQTYAWSGIPTQWDSSSIAPLEQYLNGNSFDNDRALSSNYGQWPAPKKPPAPCFGKHAKASSKRCRPVVKKYDSRKRAIAATRKAIAGVNRELKAHDCRKPYRRHVCRELGRNHKTLTKREEWFVAQNAKTRKEYS